MDRGGAWPLFCTGNPIGSLDTTIVGLHTRGKGTKMPIPPLCRTILTLFVLGAALTQAGDESTRSTVFESVAFSRNQDIYLLDSSGALERLTDTGDNGQPVVSPDGFMIAFSSKRDGDWEIFVANCDGSGLWQLTDNAASDDSPTWSPDSRRLAFASDRDGDFDVYIVWVDGHGIRHMTDDPADDLNPAWSPDGSFIAFSSERDGIREIYLVDTDGGAVSRLTGDDTDNTTPVWSADGAEVAFYSGGTGDWRSVIVPVPGSPRRNTDGP